MDVLEEAWLGGAKQMAMALPPDHPMFDIALRELSRRVCAQTHGGAWPSAHGGAARRG